jgi:hypothetical protein
MRTLVTEDTVSSSNFLEHLQPTEPRCSVLRCLNAYRPPICRTFRVALSSLAALSGIQQRGERLATCTTHWKSSSCFLSGAERTILAVTRAPPRRVYFVLLFLMTTRVARGIGPFLAHLLLMMTRQGCNDAERN